MENSNLSTSLAFYICCSSPLFPSLPSHHCLAETPLLHPSLGSMVRSLFIEQIFVDFTQCWVLHKVRGITTGLSEVRAEGEEGRDQPTGKGRDQPTGKGRCATSRGSALRSLTP